MAFNVQPKKLVSADIFGSFGPTIKIKIQSSAVCLRNFVIESAYVQTIGTFRVFFGLSGSSQQLPGISLYFGKHSVL